MKKAYLSAILIVLIVFQSVFVTTASARTVEEQDIEIIVELGLMRGDENGDLRLGDSVTRAEFTALALRLMGLEELAYSRPMQINYDDVSEDHWARGLILLASEMGIINGVGNNRFEPERPVSQNEAIKIVVCALGYGPMALHMGDEFPATYINIATKLKLLRGLDGQANFTRGHAAILLKNALTVDIMDGMGKVITGNTVLRRYLDVTAMRGFVTGTETVNSNDQIKPGYIEIEGKIYKLRQKIDEELFGCEVNFYLSKNDKEGEVIYYLEVLENDNRLVVPSEDILPSTTLSELRYIYGKNTDKVARLSGGLLIYYNGRKVGSADRNAQRLMPNQGEVTLLDKEGDGVYDAAIVTDYQTVVVNHISQDKIYDIFHNHIAIDTDVTVSISRNGEDIDASELKTGDVLAVAKSLDNQKVKILADYKKITGYVSYITESRTGDVYGVVTENGETIELQPSVNYINAVTSGKAPKLLEIDKRVLDLWVDAFDKIAYAEVMESEVVSSTTTQYGYILSAFVRKDFEDKVFLKMLTEDNRIGVYVLADKTAFARNVLGAYSQRNSTPSEVLTALGGADNLNRQLVQFRADESGTIKRLYLADFADNPDVISLDVPKDNFYYRQGVLEQKYFVDDTTLVFSVPADGAYESVVSAGKPSQFFSEGWARECTLYDVENGHVGAVVVHDKVTITYDSPQEGFEEIISYAASPILFVSGSARRLAEDGEYYFKIDGKQNGEDVSKTLSEELRVDMTVINQLSRGSVIQYETNAGQKSWAQTSDEVEQIVVFEKLFDFEEDMGSGIRWNHNTAYSESPEIMTLWGTLKSVDPGYCSVEVDTSDGPVSYPIRFLSNTVFMEYDKTNYEFKNIRHEQLTAGQRVYIFKQSSCMNVVVY